MRAYDCYRGLGYPNPLNFLRPVGAYLQDVGLEVFGLGFGLQSSGGKLDFGFQGLIRSFKLSDFRGFRFKSRGFWWRLPFHG